MKNPPSLAIIGVGHLAGFLVRGLRRSGFEGEIGLSPRNAEKAKQLARKETCQVAKSNQEAIEGRDIIVLSTRPAEAESVLDALNFTPNQLVISVVAGRSIDQLEPFAAPAKIVTAMPISAAELGESPTLLYPDEPSARSLFELLGQVIIAPDSQTFAAASANAALYGWIFALIARMEEANRKLGLPPMEAHAMASGTFKAAAVVASSLPAGESENFIDKLATPGGITDQGLKLLSETDGLEAWERAFNEVAARLLRNRG